MTAPKIDLDAQGLKQEIATLRDRLRNRAPAWKAVGEAIRFHVEMRFQTETDFDGNPWAPLLPDTVINRRPGKILIQTANLKNSNYIRPDRDGCEVGNVSEYAPIQYFGSGDDPDRDHPARWWFPWRPDGSLATRRGTPGGDLVEEIAQTLHDYVVDGKQR